MSLFCFMIKHFWKQSHQSQQALRMLRGELKLNKKLSNLPNLLREHVCLSLCLQTLTLQMYWQPLLADMNIIWKV